MNFLKKIETWGEHHHPKWFDVLRMALGIALFIKGYYFVRNTDSLLHIMENSRFPWVSLSLAHYVAFAHLVGGFMICIGLLTRIAILFQLPVLLGAVLFVNSERGFFSESSELMYSVIILILLLVFLVIGSGPWSVDESWNRSGEKWDENRT